jgi:uncharacterized protein YgiM (DUF1202 family)
MFKILLSTILLLQVSILIPSAHAAETGTALKADSLRAEPYADAKTVGTFAKNDKVEILGKQGAWLKVKAPKSTGWVRLLSVKRGTTTTGSQTSGVLNVASGRAGTGQVVATTGVRGLSEQELKSAKFNEDEMKKLESLTLSASQGQQFANNGGLKAGKFNYLPAAAEGAR